METGGLTTGNELGAQGVGQKKPGKTGDGREFGSEQTSHPDTLLQFKARWIQDSHSTLAVGAG
jgi:hypothetical protein